MSTIPLKILFTTVCSFIFISICFSQSIIPDYKIVSVTKPKLSGHNFHFDHPALKEITIVLKKVKPADKTDKKFISNLAGGTLTLMTGINTSSEKEMNWVFNNGLQANSTNYSWNVSIRFPGQFVKNRERVKNDDGSFSVESQKGIMVDWSQGAYGLLTHENDTLGGFVLNTKIMDDFGVQEWLGKMEAESIDIKETIKRYEPNQANYHFELRGTLFDKNFRIIHNGKIYKSLIFINDKPVALFQNSPNFVFVGKRNKILPGLMVDAQTDTEEIAAVIRLAMLTVMVSDIVKDDYIEL